ncbi:MAG: cytochrome c [Caldilineae bacterium]|nr:MAG: cytochrome c [Caldilineae bacterium]
MLRSKSWLMLTALVLIGLFVVAACAPDPQAQLISPDMLPEDMGEDFVPPTPTPEPSIANLSEEEIYAGLPEEILALMPGDPAKGQELTVVNGCVGCHNLDPAQAAVAPTWHNVADTAVTRIPGMSPGRYLYESITAPNNFVVEGYPSGVMPQTYGETLSPQDLADILTYLLSLHGE